MSDLRHPDIEIYVHDRNLQQLENWLQKRCNDVVRLYSFGAVHEYRGVINGRRVPVLVHERVAGGDWSSVWFKSSHTPWQRDLDCALEAAAALDTWIRCLTSDWIRGRGDRTWWLIGDGQMSEVVWR